MTVVIISELLIEGAFCSADTLTFEDPLAATSGFVSLRTYSEAIKKHDLFTLLKTLFKRLLKQEAQMGLNRSPESDHLKAVGCFRLGQN